MDTQKWACLCLSQLITHNDADNKDFSTQNVFP